MSTETGTIRTIARWALGATLVVAGTGHLTNQREEFRAQVPDWMPINDDLVVLASGVVEIALGLALILLRRQRAAVGLVVAGFFVVIFPGNIAQYTGDNSGTQTITPGRTAERP
ncbi:MAG TPA: MauE/DoxX family redox-associated membrane protein [Acidimicrobiales bacterium]|nr:MauE/DoxX family redox-associated membrane protein [Acidimicrobiales bacterium]